MIKLTKEMRELIREGVEYIENGDPLKDVMSDADIRELVLAVRSHLIENEAYAND